MKTLAFVFGLCISAVGAVGIVVPTILVWIAQRCGTSDPFYALAAVRIAVGLILISVAPTSRAPKGLRVFGYVRLTRCLILAFGGFVAHALRSYSPRR